MIDLAQIEPLDRVYDLGSGDGRILIAAAQRTGARGVGIDIDSDRIMEATQSAKQAGVAHLLTFQHQDLFDSDFQDATVVILYLLTHLNLRLLPTLRQLQAGTRIISYNFDMGDWQAEQVVRVPTQDEGMATVYRWTI